MTEEKDDMALPEGYSCADCGHFRYCTLFIGAKYINAEQHRCDWAPSRFVLRVPQREGLNV